MPKAEWGTKRICPTTGKRFYDLNRTPIISPYSGEVIDLEIVRRTAAGAVIAQPTKAKRAPEDELEADDLIEADDDAGDLDDELLEDDDDTVSLDELADVPGKDEED